MCSSISPSQDTSRLAKKRGRTSGNSTCPGVQGLPGSHYVWRLLIIASVYRPHRHVARLRLAFPMVSRFSLPRVPLALSPARLVLALRPRVCCLHSRPNTCIRFATRAQVRPIFGLTEFGDCVKRLTISIRDSAHGRPTISPLLRLSSSASFSRGWHFCRGAQAV